MIKIKIDYYQKNTVTFTQNEYVKTNVASHGRRKK